MFQINNLLDEVYATVTSNTITTSNSTVSPYTTVTDIWIGDPLPDFWRTPFKWDWTTIEIPETKISKWNDNYPDYPVTDNYILENGDVVLEIAVTGRKKEDIQISCKDEYLTIKTIKKEKDKEDKKVYLHRKIARRDFDITFKCSTKLDLDKIEAKVEDGILSILIPLKEESKPKVREVKIK